jgi:hypothetical protein
MNFQKIAPIRVLFSSGFLGAGFPGEQFAPSCF